MRRLSRLVLSLLASVMGILTPLSPLLAAPLQQESPALTLTPIGTYATGIFDEGASEIIAYDSASKRLFSVNAAATSV